MKKFNTSYIGLRYEIIRHVKGRKLNILDVGCATGVNGKFLLENEIATHVDGIEFDNKMAQVAAKKYNKVYVGDLNNDDFLDEISKSKFTYDYIIYGDILEHLIDPLKVIKSFNTLLSSRAKIIISVPNISHLELFIQVYIKGTFPQNERGIFDKTHLSWFTKKDIISLVKSAGYNNVDYHRVFRSRDELGSKFNLFTKILKRINKDWVTFQHILVCSYD